MHFECLVEAARRQHGIALHGAMPSSLDEVEAALDVAFATVGRFFGVLSVSVDSISCPRCRRPSQLWRKMPCAGKVEAATTSRVVESVLTSLRCGAPLLIADVRAALHTAAAGGLVQKPAAPGWSARLRLGSATPCAEDDEDGVGDGADPRVAEVEVALAPWVEAAASDEALRSLMRGAGCRAGDELCEVFERVAEFRTGAAKAHGCRRRVQIASPSSGGAWPSRDQPAVLQHARFLWG